MLAVALTPFASSVSAGVCDYRPSNLIGGGGTGATVATAGGVAVAGTAAKAAGFYTLTHAVTGATMLGSAAGGASAAGTVGIMGGTAGFIGTAASIIMAPAVIIGAAVVGGGIAVYEGGCYFTIERVDDPKVIREVVAGLAASADDEALRVTTEGGEEILLIAQGHDKHGRAIGWDRYYIENLYIEEGMLRHRDWGVNSNIGVVSYVVPDQE
jgi:hypothetical protein